MFGTVLFMSCWAVGAGFTDLIGCFTGLGTWLGSDVNREQFSLEIIPPSSHVQFRKH